MKVIISAQTILKEAFLNKVLVGLEYGEREVTLNQMIIRVSIDTSDCREDGGVWLMLENREEVFIYANEGIDVIDEREAVIWV